MVDVFEIISFIALLSGALLVTGALFARRGGRFRHRQGAEVLAGFAALTGALMLAVGLYAAIKA